MMKSARIYRKDALAVAKAAGVPRLRDDEPVLLSTGAKLVRVCRGGNRVYFVLGYANDGRDVDRILEAFEITPIRVI